MDTGTAVATVESRTEDETRAGKKEEAVRQRVWVTTEDIRRGAKCEPEHCPIAIAIERTVGNVPGFAAVGTYWWYWQRGETTVQRGRLPVAVSRFVQDFDSGKEVKPITFLIEMPPTSSAAKARRTL